MNRNNKLSVVITLMLVFMLACNFTTPKENATVEENIPVTGGDTSIAESLPEELPTIIPSEVPPTVEPTEVPLPTPIVHVISPVISLPNEKPQVVYDQESNRRAEQKEAYAGDEFLIGRYERPFDQEMTYNPSIDIRQTNLIRAKDNEFIYTSIILMEDPTLLPAGEYGVGIELDVDIDGRGDYIIWSKLPVSTEWSVDGVSVWQDANEDIGGTTPMVSDVPAGGDGYEILVFDSGDGTDSDLAWARVSPDVPALIEIAFKNSILGNTTKFLWGAWSILGPVQFDQFDHNDFFTYEQAGAATRSDSNYYPLKELYNLDNTCRAASGFTPQGYEPGLCPLTPVEKDKGPICRYVCSPNYTHLSCRWICD